MPIPQNHSQDEQQDDQQEYKPDLYGFPFKNVYRFGLCGGMSFGSYDYFKAQKPIRSRNGEECDKMRDDLRFFFAQRQAESLRNPVFRNFFEYMFCDNERQLETNKSFQHLKNHLSPKTPINLCMIRTLDLLSATKNHQVLAYNFETRGENRESLLEYRVYVYDPNWERSGYDVYIQVETEIDSNEEKIKNLIYNAGDDLFGFFINTRYVSDANPPDI